MREKMKDVEMPAFNAADMGGLMGMMGTIMSGEEPDEDMVMDLMKNPMISGLLQNTDLMSSILDDNPMIDELLGDDINMKEYLKDPEIMALMTNPKKME